MSERISPGKICVDTWRRKGLSRRSLILGPRVAVPGRGVCSGPAVHQASGTRGDHPPPLSPERRPGPGPSRAGAQVCVSTWLVMSPWPQDPPTCAFKGSYKGTQTSAPKPQDTPSACLLFFFLLIPNVSKGDSSLHRRCTPAHSQHHHTQRWSWGLPRGDSTMQGTWAPSPNQHFLTGLPAQPHVPHLSPGGDLVTLHTVHITSPGQAAAHLVTSLLCAQSPEP